MAHQFTDLLQTLEVPHCLGTDDMVALQDKSEKDS
jgi:hypothetical protein